MQDERTNTRVAIGPPELRIAWQPDPIPYDPGDCDDAETWRYVDLFGVYGCTVETRAPACPCCGIKSWQHGASLWGIVGDPDYWRTVEADLMDEAMHDYARAA